jgi:phage major head subunit gpT-like protein
MTVFKLVGKAASVQIEEGVRTALRDLHASLARDGHDYETYASDAEPGT